MKKASLFLIVAMMFVALGCSRDSGIDRNSDSNSEGDSAVVSDAEIEEIITMTAEADHAFEGQQAANAQEPVLPPGIDLFQYAGSASGSLNMSEFPSVRIWGWSRDGKAAYSVERAVDGRGGRIIDFVIIDLITDNKVFEQRIDSFDHDDSGDDYSFEDLFFIYGHILSDALRSNNIVPGQRNDFLSFPFRRNNITYNSQIIDIGYINDEYGMFERVISRYSILVTADNRRKIISNIIPVSRVTLHTYVCGYFLSPFENRIMAVTAEEFFGFEGTTLNYRFNGCHLGVGFN